MQRREATTERVSGQTSGSAQRPAHQIDAVVTDVDLNAAVDALRLEPAWLQGDRNARTFFKESDLRVILTVMKAGAVLREHRVPGAATVQMLSGRIGVGLAGQVLELTAGRLLILEPNVTHNVEAREDSAFLITIAWEGGLRGDAGRA